MLAKMTKEEILALIAEKQAMQKRYPVTHPLWQRASTILNELFAEMARRNNHAV